MQSKAMGAEMQMKNQELLGNAQFLKQISMTPLETWTPDIFSSNGAMTQAGQIAAINAFKSKDLEKKINPEAASAREQMYHQAAEMSAPNYWEKQMNEWAKTKGLQNQLQSGLQDGTIGKSAFFDQATGQGQAFKLANQAAIQQIIGNAPTAGIDPGQAIAAQNAAQAQGMQERGAFNQAILGGAGSLGNAVGGNIQSISDAASQLMGASSQAVNAHNKNWQNWFDAVRTGQAEGAAGKNASSSSMIGAGGAALGLAAAVAI
jgi:hypothetical protein